MKTLHIVAILLCLITSVQLIVFVHIFRSHASDDSGGGEGVSDAHMIDKDGDGVLDRIANDDVEVMKGVISKGIVVAEEKGSNEGEHREQRKHAGWNKNNIENNNQTDGTVSNKREQSVGLRVIGNLLKMRDMLDDMHRVRVDVRSSTHHYPIARPIIPDKAFLMKADDRYDPSAPPVANAVAADDELKESVNTFEGTARKDEAAASRQLSTVAGPQTPTVITPSSAQRSPMAEGKRDGFNHPQQPSTSYREQQKQQRLHDDTPSKESRFGEVNPSDESAVQVIGDIFEKEGRAIEERLSAMSPSEYNSLLVNTQPPASAFHLKDAAIIVLGYNRPQYLTQTLDALRTADLANSIKKYVSIDGNDAETLAVAKQYGEENVVDSDVGGGYSSSAFELIHHHTRPVFSNSNVKGTMFAAAHYKRALDFVFIHKQHSHAIVLEDDIVVSKDFVSMFETLAPLLDVDPTLWCVSSWNDNGFRSFELQQDKFFRTSYFPGLGWMLKRSPWVEELSPYFPVDNWDHWMRASSTSQRRDCIVPWVSRNRNIGASGTTADAEFYQLYIQPIVAINNKNTLTSGGGGAASASAPFAYKAFGDLSYLLSHKYYESFRRKLLDGSHAPRRRVMLASNLLPLGPHNYQNSFIYSIGYTETDFEQVASQLMIRTTPRAIYRHTLHLQYNGADIFLVNRRLSPFADSSIRIRKDSSLIAVVAQDFGVSCTDVCNGFGSEGGGQYHCDANQFAFINDCKVLGRLVPQHCSNLRCTQAWGEDVPNIESPQLSKQEGGRQPMCLESEMMPTCEAYHPLTQRLCPCVKGGQQQQQQQHRNPNIVDQQVNHFGQGRGGGGMYQLNARQQDDQSVAPAGNFNSNKQDAPHIALVPSEQAGMTCHEVCQSFKGGPNTPYAAKGWRCAARHFHLANECPALQKYFPCANCYESRGSDLPNYVSNRDNGQYGRCLFTQEGMGCGGSHPHTQRLCPCSPEY